MRSLIEPTLLEDDTLTLVSLRVGRLSRRKGIPSKAFHHEEWLERPPELTVDTEILGRETEDRDEVKTETSSLPKQMTADLATSSAVRTVEDRSRRCFAIVGCNQTIVARNCNAAACFFVFL